MTDEFIREAQCRRITGLSRSTRWRLERASQFPRRRSISPGCVAWLRTEIEDWIAERAAVRVYEAQNPVKPRTGHAAA